MDALEQVFREVVERGASSLVTATGALSAQPARNDHAPS
jgi:hypothetical protein